MQNRISNKMEYSVIKFRCRISDFIGLYILFAVASGSNGLECFACNYTGSTLKHDRCLPGSISKCASNSVCLAATYETSSLTGKQYNIIWTCFPYMANEECEHFIKGQRNTQTAIIQSHSCYTCTSDLCNKERPKSSNYGGNLNAGFATVIVSILSSYILKLLIA